MSLRSFRILCLMPAVWLFSMVCAPQVRAQEPFTVGSIPSALASASKTGRIVLVAFYATSPDPSKFMEDPALQNELMWKDTALRAWMSKTAVSRKINAEQQPELAAKYKIYALPTLLLLKPNGAEIDRLTGFRDPKTLLAEMKQALAGQTGLVRARARRNTGEPSQAMARLFYADALAERDYNADALKEYLWCLDEGDKKDKGFAASMLPILLGDIARLGKRYPPALAVMQERRNALRAALENGSADKDVAAAFVEYNENLKQEADTLEVYDRIKARNAPAAATLFHSLSDVFLERKRYAEFLAETENPDEAVNTALAALKNKPESPPSNKQTTKQMSAVQTQITEGMLKVIGGYYEAYLGTDKTREAEAMSVKLLAFDPGSAMYSRLIRHALRAGKPETAQKLKEAAKAALSAADFAQIK